MSVAVIVGLLHFSSLSVSLQPSCPFSACTAATPRSRWLREEKFPSPTGYNNSTPDFLLKPSVMEKSPPSNLAFSKKMATHKINVIPGITGTVGEPSIKPRNDLLLPDQNATIKANLQEGHQAGFDVVMTSER
ncbi:hypothetical protein V6N12_027608 [Hibiscus sabdariffa]|uniref:Uncharacterized protein n=1 Tax=Hibiscus sabdariffa TaxID=183260 RepID=A0ABR2F3E0_9ROSI